MLSIIDWGTLFHPACVLKDKVAGRVRRAYRRLWLRVPGPPRKIVSDQGLEFVGREFSERLEADGTLHAITGADAPWQNARTERHGGTLKKMISRARLDVVPESKDDLEEIISNCVSAKNRLLSNSGFSPYQRVLGYQPLIPGSLIADGDRDHDIAVSAKILGGDAALIRAMNIRTAAAKAFAETDAQERIRRAVLGP